MQSHHTELFSQAADRASLLCSETSTPLSHSVLRDYYDAQQEQLHSHDVLAGACRLPFPSEHIKAARVLDVQCRGAKGVCCLADKVKQDGFVWGVDTSLQNIEHARCKAPAYLQRSNLPVSMVHFSCTYPETLYEHCTEQVLYKNKLPFNFVFASASLNVCYSMSHALQQIRAVLAPGGVFVFDAVLCTIALSSQQRLAARRKGDQLYAALTYEELKDELLRCGFVSVKTYGHEALRMPSASIAPSASTPVELVPELASASVPKSASVPTSALASTPTSAPRALEWYRAVVQASIPR